MFIGMEFWLDCSTKEKPVIMRVANNAIAILESKVPGVILQNQQLLVPGDAEAICWRFGVQADKADRVREILPKAWRQLALQEGILSAAVIEKMKAKDLMPAYSAPSQKKKPWWKFW